jgi:hypothetical protein
MIGARSVATLETCERLLREINKYMKITLTIEERFAVTKILNEFRGSLDKLAIILEDIKLFPLTDEELAKIGGKKSFTPEGKQVLNWSIQLGETLLKEIEIQEETVDYLIATIKKKSDDGKLGIEDSSVITLKKKLN